ncbi:GNAT family N-acetyltransferase [Clostridium perfringens]|nr:GNAT family N-acetyltransferase [Clostridium perfringens]
MYIRNYRPEDCKEITKLFYETVHTVNKKDYTESQLNVWATENIDLELWNKLFIKNFTLVVCIDDIIVGFGDISDTGYLDRLYVHKDYQHKGIATKIVNCLEKHVKKLGVNTINTEASITAKKFFESKGYIVIRSQLVKRQDEFLKNFLMEKKI